MKGNMNLALWMWNNPILLQCFVFIGWEKHKHNLFATSDSPCAFLTQSDSSWTKEPSDKREEMGQRRIEQDKTQSKLQQRR